MALGTRNPNGSIASSWRLREPSRLNLGGGSWYTSTGALITRSYVRRNWTRTARPSRGWRTTGCNSCTPDHANSHRISARGNRRSMHVESVQHEGDVFHRLEDLAEVVLDGSDAARQRVDLRLPRDAGH